MHKIKRVNKFLCILGSAVFLAVSSCLFCACDTDKAGEFYYTFREDNTVTVFVERYDMTELVIPDSICGYRVSAIGAPKKADKINTTLVKIVIPDTVQFIEKSAFENCIGFTELHLPKGLLAIGNYAFRGCSSFEDLNLPEGLKEVGKHAFSHCSSLTNAHLPISIEKMGDRVFEGCPLLEIYAARESAPGWLDPWGYNWSGNANVHYGAA